MIKNTSPDDPWQPCEQGMIRSVAGRSLGRRQMLTKLAVGSVVIAGGGIAAFAWLGKTPPRRGGISCKVVHQNLDAFIAETLDDATLVAQMTAHVKKCKPCHMEFRSRGGHMDLWHAAVQNNA